MKVLVVGAGIGGLGAAISLRQRGFAVDVVEIKPELSVPGVGINQPANSLRALRSMGVLDQVVAAGCPYDHTDFFTADGELIVHVPSTMGGDVPANTALSRLNLHKILISGAGQHDVAISYGTAVERFTDTGRAVDVRFTDGRQENYDLVAAFDGIKSATRRAVFGPGHDAVHSGSGVFRVTLPRPDYVDGVRVYQALGVRAGYIPLSATTMYMFVVTPDSRGVSHRREDFAAILKERMAPFGALPGEVREGLKPADDIVYSPIADVLLPLPWFSGRVGILGDAAHACAPHLTQGAAMALEDGMVLADCLDTSGSLDDRLRAFEQRRFPRARLVQDVSRGLLQADMSIDAGHYELAIQGLRDHLVEQTHQVEAVLNQPA